MLVFVLALGCAKSHDEDIQRVKDILTESYMAMDRFAKALDQAGDNGAIVSAIKRYEQDLDQLMPKAKAAEQAMKNINGASPPGELKEIIDKIKEITGPFLNSYKKVFDHSQDPAVNQALASMMQKNNAMPALAIW